MLDTKNYVGKVVRLSYSRNGTDVSQTGVVYGQENQDGRAVFKMLLTSGQLWTGTFRVEDNLKFSSVRIDEDLRKALTDFCKIKIKQDEFLNRFTQEKRKHEDNVQSAINTVKERSDEMTSRDFVNVIRDLFQERYPSSGGWNEQRYFDCHACSSTDVTVCQCQEIEKYATPERYSFLYREYDGYLFVRGDCKEHDDFCRRYAPPVLPELKRFESKVYATLGDKNFLEVQRDYKIPLKYGVSKRSIEHIKESVFGIKPSLNNAIASAEKQKGSNAGRIADEKSIDGR